MVKRLRRLKFVKDVVPSDKSEHTAEPTQRIEMIVIWDSNSSTESQRCERLIRVDREAFAQPYQLKEQSTTKYFAVKI